MTILWCFIDTEIHKMEANPPPNAKLCHQDWESFFAHHDNLDTYYNHIENSKTNCFHFEWIGIFFVHWNNLNFGRRKFHLSLAIVIMDWNDNLDMRHLELEYISFLNKKIYMMMNQYTIYELNKLNKLAFNINRPISLSCLEFFSPHFLLWKFQVLTSTWVWHKGHWFVTIS